MPNSAVESLIATRNLLEADKNRTIENFDKQISEIETAILTLTGKKVWEIPQSERYDDENPNYIKSSIED